jgi:acetyl-CoA C-acetyltransferase
MLFECRLQLRGEAGKHQIASIDRGRKPALTHNLGGAPGECESFVSVVGTKPST